MITLPLGVNDLNPVARGKSTCGRYEVIYLQPENSINLVSMFVDRVERSVWTLAERDGVAYDFVPFGSPRPMPPYRMEILQEPDLAFSEMLTLFAAFRTTGKQQ